MYEQIILSDFGSLGKTTLIIAVGSLSEVRTG